MIYAFITDGLDAERRDEFDRALAQTGKQEKAKAGRERQAVQTLMNIPGVAGGA